MSTSMVIGIALACSIVGIGPLSQQELQDKNSIVIPFFQQFGVRYDFDISKCPPSQQGTPLAGYDRYRSLTTLDGISWRRDEKFEYWDHDGKRLAVERVQAFDGTKHCTLTMPSFPLYLMKTMSEADRKKSIGDAFLDFYLVNPTQPGATGLADQSRVTLLATPGLIIRPILEDVDGRMCHVIEGRFFTGNLDWVVWIDAERGCVPMKQQYYSITQEQNHEMLKQFTATKVIESIAGVWVVVEGEKLIFPDQSLEQIKYFKVDEDYSNSLILGSTNAVTIVPEIPPMYSVQDLDKGTRWQSK
jgi:hypothetical protein